MNLRSITDMNAAITRNLWRIDRSKFDVVVGIPRSGMIPASIIATLLQMPLATVEGYVAGLVSGRSGKMTKPRGRVLLVDDTSNHGRAMERAVEAIKDRAKQITRLAIFGPYQVEEPHKIVDLWFEDCRGPRAFEWNILKHARLRRWAFDFDGVLCRDPTKAENDDGPAYEAFLCDAEPLLLPTRPIGQIITCRLEKYRPLCEEWLARHGIEHAGLVMMPYATKTERMEAGGRGAWKAEKFAASGADMMIESCPKQARIIAKRTGKPVWCVGTQSLV